MKNIMKEEFIFGTSEIKTKEEWNTLYEKMMSDLYKAISENNKEEKETNEYDEIFKTILENKPEKQIDNDLFFKLKNSDKYSNAAIFMDIDIVIYLRDGYASIDKDQLKILKKIKS